MSLFKYYQEALGLVNSGGLSSLGDVEPQFNTAGNPVASSNAGGTTDGTVPKYSYQRARVPGTYNPERRPGSRGQRYFSDSAFVPPESVAPAKTAFTQQANAAHNMNLANRLQQPQRAAYVKPTATPMQFGTYTPRTNAPSGAGAANPAPTRNDLMAFLAQKRAGQEGGQQTGADSTRNATGIAGLAGGGPAGGGPSSAYNRRYNGYAMGGMPQAQGYYLGGTTDGMADTVPARIDGNQEARLSDGEFVVPADVVSHLGNGNSSAGAKNLYGMMDRVRTARTGNKQQGKQIAPNKFMPSRTV